MKVHDLQLAFISRIISCYTHEVKNYLAIIKETGGLMKDVIKIKKSKGVDEKQFLGLVENIDDQIKRAVGITDYLHRFAHRMENKSLPVNINDLIDELLALMGRLAYRKKITFKKNLSPSLPVTVLNPTLFHYLLFCVVESKMSGLDRNGVVCVSSFHSSRRFRITVGTECGTMPLNQPESGVGEINEAASELGVTISEVGGEAVIIIPEVESSRP